MKNTIYVLFAFVGLISLSSCKEAFDYGSATNFKTESFNDFLWKKQPPVEIEAVINTEFAECEGLDKPLVLQLCDDDAKAITPKVAQLYVNGQKSENNTISIDPKSPQKETEIKIVLDKSQTDKTRTFSWYLQVVDNPGLVRVNETTPGQDPWITGTMVNWRNNHVSNPLSVILRWILILIVSFLAAWYIIAHFVVNPSAAFSRVSIQYPDSLYEIDVRMKGAYVLHLDSKEHDCSAFHKFFIGYEASEVNDFWTSPMKIKTGSRRNVIKIIGSGPYEIEPDDLVRKEPITITNENGQKATIITS